MPPAKRKKSTAKFAPPQKDRTSWVVEGFTLGESGQPLDQPPGKKARAEAMYMENIANESSLAVAYRPAGWDSNASPRDGMGMYVNRKSGGRNFTKINTLPKLLTELKCVVLLVVVNLPLTAASLISITGIFATFGARGMRLFCLGPRSMHPAAPTPCDHLQPSSYKGVRLG